MPRAPEERGTDGPFFAFFPAGVPRSRCPQVRYAYSPQDPPFVQTPSDHERDGGECVLLAQADYELFGAPGWTGYAVWVMYRHDLEAMAFAKAMGGVLASHP
ncbi:hypothetical protein [Nocardiopsis alborubida]|uniref:hypothetical protein n=1 Tax=Nocardiopsis alborubida TaxID=146802 RepID=UPI00076E31D2|nr:hypothetical protein [Nocardiopsis alborubida]